MNGEYLMEFLQVRPLGGLPARLAARITAGRIPLSSLNEIMDCRKKEIFAENIAGFLWFSPQKRCRRFKASTRWSPPVAASLLDGP